MLSTSCFFSAVFIMRKVPKRGFILRLHCGDHFGLQPFE